MKYLLLLFVFNSFTLFAQEKKDTSSPFSALRSDSIVLYDFNKFTRPDASIVAEEDGNRRLGKFDKKVTLTGVAMKDFTMRVEATKSYGGNVAACFEPHLGVVFYRENSIQAYINICMDCNRLEPSILLLAQNQGKQVTAEGEVYYTLTGMSKKFRGYLNNLLMQHNFSHHENWKPTFD